MNEAILHAIFGDGCAVAVVGGRTARNARPGSMAILDNRSWLVRGGSRFKYVSVVGAFKRLYRIVCV